MLGLLLQVNGLEDVVFSLGNIITIGGGAVATLTAFLKLQYNQKAEEKATAVRFETIEKEYRKEINTVEKEYRKEVETINNSIVHVQNGKRALRKELLEIIKEKDEMTRARIDKTQSEMKAYSEKTDQEFKEINSSISNVKQDTSEIKGMIQTLLNNNKN
jgi:hypothetical protein